MSKDSAVHPELPKSPTGIKGFDEITFGGLPKGRPSLVCGGPGSGKTLFGMEFLVKGATWYDEPGVFISFEEPEGDLAANFGSLGFDLQKLQADRKIAIDYIRVDRSEIEETGAYNLDGLFVRLGLAIDSVGARRIVLDTLEALFSSFADQLILRAEIRRLFGWLKERGITAVITAERGENRLTRHGLEEYVSDCVIFLDHRIRAQISTRRLQVVKYRGSVHGTNEYPFLIDTGGFAVLPITSVGLDYRVSDERITTGLPELDEMFGGRGVYKGSSLLVSGTAGTGKSSFASCFANRVCRDGGRCLYYALEESSSQVIRNMRSIGLDLQPWVDKELLVFHAIRPTLFGLEMHVASMYRHIREFKPGLVVVDPISNLVSIGTAEDVKSALTRLVDLFKSAMVTSLFTSLVRLEEDENSQIGISSLMDTWIRLTSIESGGEHDRALFIIKSRGMPHSNQIREFQLTDSGIKLVKPARGPSGMVIGAARRNLEAERVGEAVSLNQEIELMQRELERKRRINEAQMTVLRSRFESDEEELLKKINENKARECRASDRT